MEDTRKTQQAAFSAGTFGNLLTQWVKFLLFCARFRLRALPASAYTLAWYAQYLSYSFKSYGSIVNYLAGVKTLHKYLMLPLQAFTEFPFRLAMRGLRWLNNHVTKRALPMTPAILSEIYQVLDHNHQDDVTFWAMCLVAFFLLLRKSNLVPDTKNSVDCRKQLCKQDFEICKNNILVTLRWTKTNQYGRHETFSLPKVEGSRICPWSAVTKLFAISGQAPGLCFKLQNGDP